MADGELRERECPEIDHESRDESDGHAAYMQDRLPLVQRWERERGEGTYLFVSGVQKPMTNGWKKKSV